MVLVVWSSVVAIPLLLIGALVFVCAAIAPSSPIAALVIVLTLSPLRALIATEADLSLPLDIGQALLLLYFGIWLAYRIRARKQLLTAEVSLPLFAAIGLAAAFSIGAWQSASTWHWLTEWLKWVVVSLLIWNLSLCDTSAWPWLIFAVLVSAAANALVGLYIFLGGSGADHLLILGRFYRAFGTFGQPNPFGGFMGIALPFAIMTAFGQLRQAIHIWRSKRRPGWALALSLIFSSLASLLIMAALLASWSRGAWLGTAVALLAMMVALPRRFAHGLALAALIAILFGLFWATGLLPRSIVSRLTTTATELVTVSDVRGVNVYPWNYAVIERLAHWQAAVNMATASPLFGIGMGGYEVAYDNYRLLFWEAPLGHAHNQYLNTLAETGIVGLSAYLLFWLAILRLTWSMRRHPDNSARCAVIGLVGCWSYIAVHSLFDNLFVNNLFLHIGVLLGVLALLRLQVLRSLVLE